MAVYTLEYGCVYDLQKMPLLAKNYLFSWSSFWSWRICKQAKLSHLGHRKPARIHLKADADLKRVTVWCGFWSRGIIGSFSPKMSKGMPLQSMAIVIGPFWTNFVHKNWRGGYWQHLVSTGYVPQSRSNTRCFEPCFWRSQYQPQSWCSLATSKLRFDTVVLLFVGCCQRYVLHRQTRDNWRFKGKYS